MWSRVVEVMLGVWLVISPFVFSHPESIRSWWINDQSTGSLVVLFGLCSYWRPTRFAHTLTIVVACWLIGFAYVHGLGGPAAASQNHLIIGILLLMFAVIPNHASRPSRSWVDGLD